MKYITFVIALILLVIMGNISLKLGHIELLLADLNESTRINISSNQEIISSNKKLGNSLSELKAFADKIDEKIIQTKEKGVSK